MTTALTAWYDDVLTDLPGISPGAFALKLIRDAVIEFCQKTQAHRIDHPPIDLVALQSTYPYAPGADLVVIEPLQASVFANNVPLAGATDGDLDIQYGQCWRTGAVQPGTGAFYRLPDDSNIQIVPTPDAGVVGGLVLRVAVKPTETCAGVDDRLYNQTLYRDAIAAAVKWHAKAMAKKPFSDPQGAAYWMGEFNRMCGTAQARVARGFAARPLRSTTIHSIA